ncbi:hypothetical protein [Dysgonomonas mossii]
MKNKANISRLRKLVSIRQSVKSTHLLIAFFAIAATMGFVLRLIEN